MMRTGNPALSGKTFENYAPTGIGQESTTMTLDGTVNKSAFLVILVMAVALIPWNIYFAGSTPFSDAPFVPGNVTVYLIGGTIGGLIFALITIFKQNLSPFTAPCYAICEGFAMGALSAIFEAQYPGIALQAIFLTLAILFSLLLAYKSGLIKVTENFKLGVVAATGGIFLVYMFSFIGGMFGFNVPYIHESGLFGIGFSCFVIVVASLNLVLDFDFIEHGAESNAPKYMEWYAAFGLLVTLIWLYIEILRLLAKLRDR